MSERGRVGIEGSNMRWGGIRWGWARVGVELGRMGYSGYRMV